MYTEIQDSFMAYDYDMNRAAYCPSRLPTTKLLFLADNAKELIYLLVTTQNSQ